MNIIEFWARSADRSTEAADAPGGQLRMLQGSRHRRVTPTG